MDELAADIIKTVDYPHNINLNEDDWQRASNSERADEYTFKQINVNLNRR